MSTIRVGTVAALLAGLAWSASPVIAQDRRDSGERRDGQVQGGRRNPRAGTEGDSANRARSRDRGRDDSGSQASGGQAQAGRGDRGNRDSASNNDQARREAPQRPEARERDRNDGRRADRYDSNRDRDRDRDWDGNRDGRRDRDWDRNRHYNGRPYVVVPAPRVYRGNPYRQRSYVVPYGYRPYGYRPGWSLNLYFGRPNYVYRSRGYYGSGAYGAYGNYGYYAIPPGFDYGSLRIVDAPRDAQVFVDGYYAGVVDDYDGVFQRLNLEPGRHQVEVEVYPGAPPAEYEVFVAPGQTVTVHVRP